MEHAKKYALVAEEDLSRHVPTKKQMTEFDVAMSKILNSSLPDHEKVQQYYELLKRKMDLQEFNTPWKSKLPEEEENEPESKPEEPEPEVKQEPVNDYDTFVLNSVPNPMKKQAEALLTLLKSKSSKMNWDPSGAITYNGKKLDGNLAEYFRLIFCVNKKPSNVTSTEFLQALKDIGVPESTIKNKHLSFQKKKVVSPRISFVKQKKRDPVIKPDIVWENY